MLYVVSVINMSDAKTIQQAIFDETAYFGLYDDTTDKCTVVSLGQLDLAYNSYKEECAFEIVAQDNDTGLSLKLPAGTVNMLPFSDMQGKMLNEYTAVILYKTFAVGGIVYTIYDVVQKRVLRVTEQQLVQHAERFKQQQRVTAVVLGHKQPNNTAYIRAYSGSFPVRNNTTIKEVLDIHDDTFYGVKAVPPVVSRTLEIPQTVKCISPNAVNNTCQQFLKEKRLLYVQDLPENISLLLSYSNINDVEHIKHVKPTDFGIAEYWCFIGNSIYNYTKHKHVTCVYCLASQSNNVVILTTGEPGANVTIGANVLCKLHAYKSVTLSKIGRIDTHAFAHNTIDVLCIKGKMPTFAPRALSKADIKAVQLFGEYTAEELTRLLDIQTWWGIEDLSDNTETDVRTLPYVNVKFYCTRNTTTATLLKQTLPDVRVIEV